MDARRPQKVESEGGLWQETVPLCDRKVRIDCAESRHKMIFVGSDGAFSGIGAMFLWRDTLESYIVFRESVFKVLGAFVVEDMEGWSMTVET